VAISFCVVQCPKSQCYSVSFMQNKPNFQNGKMNVSYCITMNYEQKTMNNANKNKANTNPIYPELACTEHRRSVEWIKPNLP